MSNKTPPKTMQVGTAVMCNGYPGTVKRLTSNGMIEVRLPGGVVCVDPADEMTVQVR
jgi:hypothetical protein